MSITKADARVLAGGLLANGLDPLKLTARGRQELREAIDKLLELAGCGLTDMQRMALACGNEPYADYGVCPRCGGNGYVERD